MASVLHKFVSNTKILPSQVNENFEFLQKDITDVSESVVSKLSSTKENILSDVQTVKESLESGKAENDLNNVESSILTNALMPDYSQPTTRILATEYIAETDLFLTCTDIIAHDDYYYKLFLDYKDVKTEFHWGGYSDEPDKQRDFIAINIPKNTKFKITGFNRNNKESNVPEGTIKTFPFIGITKDNSEVSE